MKTCRIEIPDDAVLCYVDGPWAYFIEPDQLNHVCGDDWDDAPYQHNAGPPYDPYYRVWWVGGVGCFLTPAERGISTSVQEINAGAYHWLYSTAGQIGAGCPLDTFVKLIRDAGGRVCALADLEETP